MTEPGAEVRESLREIAAATEVVSRNEFCLHGRSVDIRDQPPPTGRTAGQGGGALRTRLRNALYSGFYTGTGSHSNLNPERDVDEAPGEDDLSSRLSRANRSRTLWDEGWKTIARLPDGRLATAKDSRARTWAPGQYVHDAKPRSPGAGDIVRTLSASESTAAQPGFHFFFGESAADDVERASQVRFYWNIRWEGAVRLVEALGRVLNRWRIPYQFNCPVRKRRFTRRDSGVLYVGGRRTALLRELLPSVMEAVEGDLEDGTPLFTRRIARGVGVAENPEGGESFGMDRCGIVADGLIDAFESGGDSGARLAGIERRFERRGVALAQPWLNRRGQDPHGLGEFML